VRTVALYPRKLNALDISKERILKKKKPRNPGEKHREKSTRKKGKLC
jgi:hypothetical protein